MKAKITFILMITFFVTAFVNCSKDDDPKAASPDTKTASPDTTLTGASSVTDNQGNVYKVGYTNPSGSNKNPFVSKKNSNGDEIWKIEHETASPDGTATLITLDADQNPWVIFTIDGGSTDATYITKKEIEAGAFSGILFNSYGNGGGPKVAIIAKLNPTTGKIVKGTFFMCRCNKYKSDDDYSFSGKSISEPNSKTNTIVINKIGVRDNKVIFEASNASYPPA